MNQSFEAPAPVSGRRWSDLSARAGSGLILVVVAITSARIGGALFVAVWLAAATAVLWEWQRLLGAHAPQARVVIGALGLVIAVVLTGRDLFEAFVVVAIVAVILAALAGSGRRVWAAGGMLYAGILVVAAVGLRFSFPFGSRSIIWLFATVWSTDTFAYFGGRLIGGPKLSPRISPSKTWSGTATGLLAGAIIGTFVVVRDLPGPTALVQIFMVTLAASFFSQAGDAFESAIKRRFGVKDSSRLIPGHGGVMDRLDGFIAAAAFALCLGLIRDPHSIAQGLLYWA